AAQPAHDARRAQSNGPQPLRDIIADDVERFRTGIEEFDRVLGGGLVAGGVVMLGGDPGVGKSTLLMQVLVALSADGKRALYVTGEESAAQVALRARRIGMSGDVMLIATTELDEALRALEADPYQVVVIDSIQTLRSAELEASVGSVAQLRDVASALTDHAKRAGCAMFLIGHVTKEGALAGPKVLEHLVDTVLSFEGDATHAYRMVRAEKNRFGPAHEVGVFEMLEDGLREVRDPSRLFIEERPEQVAGSLITATAEGSRPLLVEVQALVAPAQYGTPRRVATGLDANRLAVLLAVLHRKAGIQVLDQDVFASAAGGVRVDEPAADLALCAAVVSSLTEKPVPAQLVMFGEVGLAGEVRAVPRPGARLKEARKMGFSRVVLPAANAARLSPAETEGLRLMPVARLEEALEHLAG
ncbi:MAG: DNA repair protein RadA, partial [Myxococcales bacterium]|nr:DNA repair protein RadA [Myxococcales bacterium]